ncbi:MAG: hypothetical protein RIM33_15255 [Alphaproteobacteria bacterium]
MKTVLTAATVALSMGLAMPAAFAASGTDTNEVMNDREAYENHTQEMIWAREEAMKSENVDLSDEAEEAWSAVKDSWSDMSDAAAENWEDAKASFQENWDAFQEEWDELTDGNS